MDKMRLFSLAKFNTLRFEVEELYKGIFEIDPVTGEVFVPPGNKDKLDYEKRRSYEIQITVKDRCDTGNCYGKFPVVWPHASLQMLISNGVSSGNLLPFTKHLVSICTFTGTNVNVWRMASAEP
jgi:hypothetical protein